MSSVDIRIVVCIIVYVSVTDADGIVDVHVFVDVACCISVVNVIVAVISRAGADDVTCGTLDNFTADTYIDVVDDVLLCC